MKVLCPHCSQRIALDVENIESMRGTSSFTCPTCEGQIPLVVSMANDPIPSQDKHQGSHWTAPDVQEMERNFDSRYKIQRILGRGGMGAVYEGFDTRLDRRVAIKILPPDAGKDIDALARFEREAKAMAALDHPNIVKIHDFGQTLDGNPFLIMEFIDGMDIHVLRQGGHLDLPNALDLISQVCSALQFAHNRGIIHRDIKPANIMVSREGVAKVTDFGLARMLGTEDLPNLDPSLTRSGTAMGTPDYMAPEQMEGQRVDHRADIYSLGIMLYDLLTGSPPRGAWPPPSHRVQIDVRLDEIVLRALQHNPSARYQAASEVQQDVDSVKTSTGGEPIPLSTAVEPLPSTINSLGNAKSKTPQTWQPSTHSTQFQELVYDAPSFDAIVEATRRTNRTMLLLGTFAVLTIGAIAIYVRAFKKDGDIYNTVNNTSYQEIRSIYFSQIIVNGTTTEKDLEDVIGIRPYGTLFIGISKAPVTLSGARNLAKRTGSRILDYITPQPNEPEPLNHWLTSSFSLEQKAWVKIQGQHQVIDNVAALTAATAEAKYRVLLSWQGPKELMLKAEESKFQKK